VKKRSCPTLLLVVMVVMFASQARGQEIMLDSEPPGLFIRIEGSAKISGTAPIPLEDLSLGSYMIRSHGVGVAEGRARFRRVSEDDFRTKNWAGAYALLLPPGFLHFHRGEKFRGFLYFLAGATGAVGIVVKENDRRQADDLAQEAQEIYNQAVSPEAIAEAAILLSLANEAEAEEAQLRNLWALYLGIAWVGAGLEGWLLTPTPKVRPVGSNQYVLDVPAVNRWSAAMRSAIAPGAGQRYTGKYGKGNFYTAGFFLMGALTLIAQDNYLDAKRDQDRAQFRYNRSESQEEVDRNRRALFDAADNTNDWDTRRRIFLGATAVVYLWNIADAYSLGASQTVKRSMSWSVLPTPDGFRTALTWRLP
jgi:hypothetical protein